MRVTNDTSVANQIKKWRSEASCISSAAHDIYSNLVPLLTLGSTEALCIAGKGNSRIDVNVM